MLNEGPQDMQEFIHQDAQGLHLGERVIGPPLQLGIKLSEARIVLDMRKQVK